MIYRHKRSGVIVEVQSRVSGPDWEEVVVPSPSPAVDKTTKKPAARKTAARK